MINLRRIFMVSAALVAINMQGCGCSDDKKYYPPGSGPGPEPEQTFTVSGAASKGILRNFEISAHSFIAGGINPVPIASDHTNNLGAYTLRIPETYREQPLLYRVKPRASGSIMTCDLADGCGEGVAFGEDLPVTDASFTLDSVVPSAGNSLTTNISVFTDLASGLAIRSLVEINNGNSDVIRNAIARSNSQIANRFGLTGNLHSLPVIDLTNAAAVKAALDAGNAHFVQYAAMNAAIAQAAWADSDSGIFGAMDSFREYFVGGGIPANTEMDNVTSYAEILNAAQHILRQVQDRDPEAPLNVAALLQNLMTEEALANSEEPDVPDQGTPSEVSSNPPLEKVKAMVEDLRNLAVSFGDVSVNGGTIGSIAEDFAMQIEAAEMASSDDTSHVTHAMAIAAKAIDDANRAYSNNPERTSYTSEDGVTVTIAAVAGSARFSVDQEIVVATDDGDVTVEVVLDADNAMDYAGDREDLTVDGRYAVVGTAISAAISVEIKDGSSIAISNVEVVQEADEEAGTETQTETMDEFALNLQVEISQVKSDELVDPVTIKGALSVLLTNARVVHTEGEESTTARLSASILDLKLSGMVGNDSGESASFVVALNGDATGVEFVETWYEDWERETTETWEDEDNFSAFYGSIAFTAKLSGIPNAVVLNFNVARTGYENAENTLTIRYPGKQFRFHMLVADGAPDGALTITNHDGVVMSLVETEVDGENRLTGTISLDGVQYATIEDDRTITIHYSDDTFESL